MPSAEAKHLYRVKDLDEAAFLSSRGFAIVGKEPAEGDRKWFLLFEETPELRKAVNEFYGKECRERDVLDAFRRVKKFIYDR